MHQESSGEIDSEVWSPQLRLRSGQRVNLAGYGKATAERAQEAISQFLALS